MTSDRCAKAQSFSVSQHEVGMSLMRSMTLCIVVMVGLMSCVTTTTGGFSTEPSHERAEREFVQLAIG